MAVGLVQVNKPVDVWVDWGKESSSTVRSVAKAVRYTIDWAEKGGLLSKKDELWGNAHTVAGKAMGVTKLVEIPASVRDIAKHTHKIWGHPREWKNWAKLGSEVTNLYDLVVSGVLNLFWTAMPKEVDHTLTQIGHPVLAAGMTLSIATDAAEVVDLTHSVGRAQRNAREAGNDIDQAKYHSFTMAADAQRLNKVLKIAQWTSFLVLGILGIASMFFGVGAIFGVAIGTYLLGCATIALICSVAASFHKKLVVEPAFQTIANRVNGHAALREYGVEVRNAQGQIEHQAYGKVPEMILVV